MTHLKSEHKQYNFFDFQSYHPTSFLIPVLFFTKIVKKISQFFYNQKWERTTKNNLLPSNCSKFKKAIGSPEIKVSEAHKQRKTFRTLQEFKKKYARKSLSNCQTVLFNRHQLIFSKLKCDSIFTTLSVKKLQVVP